MYRLALNPGGSTFYFGAVGEDGSAVRGYFAERGVDCPPNKNVAEFILETAAKGGKRKDNKRLDWNREWKESKENQNLLDEIKRINSTRSKIPASQTDTKHEFAAPVWEQTTMLTKRMFIQQWRDPSYIYGKLFVSVIVGSTYLPDPTLPLQKNLTADIPNLSFYSLQRLHLLQPRHQHPGYPKPHVHLLPHPHHPAHARQLGSAQVLQEPRPVGEARATLAHLRLDSFLHCEPRFRGPERAGQRGALLAPMVPAHRPTDGRVDGGLRFPNDAAVLCVPDELGAVDLRLCAELHGHQQRPSVLLRHVYAVQWGRGAVFAAGCFLEVLDVLGQSGDVLDWGRFGGDVEECER